MRSFLPASLALALAAPMGAAVSAAEAPGAEIAALRQEIDAMRAAYESRLQVLEVRLRAAEARLGAADASAAAPAAVAATAAPVAAPAAQAPAAANAFNPAISLILSGLYTRTSKDPARYGISGFLLPVGGDAGPGTRGFSLSESELGLAASIDPWWRGAANISLHGDDTVSVEEAYVQTTALGHGLSLKAGRFFSGIGYLNAQHAHTWDFVDNPLAYQAMLGTQFGDDGVQLSWLAPVDTFVELGMEVGRGRPFPGGDNSRNGAGAMAFTAHAGGDIGASHSWRAGVSVLNAKADDQALAGQDAAGSSVLASFSGRTRIWIADAVWKWAPEGNATRTNFKLQGEFLRSTRTGNLDLDNGAAGGVAPYRAVATGWYVQGVYQFMPHWRLGLRTERLNPGSGDAGANAGANAGALAADGLKPRKHALMLDFSASEFSRIRLQLAQERSLPGAADKQLFVQYQMSLGAHGAHSY